jgi:hypothetical protein
LKNAIIRWHEKYIPAIAFSFVTYQINNNITNDILPFTVTTSTDMEIVKNIQHQSLPSKMIQSPNVNISQIPIILPSTPYRNKKSVTYAEVLAKLAPIRTDSLTPQGSISGMELD